MTRITAPGLRVLFADDSIVVVDKRAGMPSVPARSAADPPDVARVLGPFLPPGGSLEAAHRLDRDTSGLLLLARGRDARRALGRAFERGEVEKTYVALVCGRPPIPAGTISQPLAPDPLAPPRQRVDPVVGRPATTRFETIGVAAERPELSVLRLEPVTGRSHQLRVHLAWLGCPVLGDPLYGRAGSHGGGRMWLHAARIALAHPADGRRLAFLAPLCLEATVNPPSTAPGTRQASDGVGSSAESRTTFQ